MTSIERVLLSNGWNWNATLERQAIEATRRPAPPLGVHRLGTCTQSTRAYLQRHPWGVGAMELAERLGYTKRQINSSLLYLKDRGEIERAGMLGWTPMYRWTGKKV